MSNLKNKTAGEIIRKFIYKNHLIQLIKIIKEYKIKPVTGFRAASSTSEIIIGKPAGLLHGYHDSTTILI